MRHTKTAVLMVGFWLVGVFLCLTPLEAGASTKTWDGSSNGNWGTAANWSGGFAPVSGDDLVFPAGVSRLIVTNNIAGLLLKSLAFTGSNYVVRGVGIQLTNGISAAYASKTNSIELDITIGSNQIFTTSGGVLEILGNFVLNGFIFTVCITFNTRLDGIIIVFC